MNIQTAVCLTDIGEPFDRLVCFGAGETLILLPLKLLPELVVVVVVALKAVPTPQPLSTPLLLLLLLLSIDVALPLVGVVGMVVLLAAGTGPCTTGVVERERVVCE